MVTEAQRLKLSTFLGHYGTGKKPPRIPQRFVNAYGPSASNFLEQSKNAAYMMCELERKLMAEGWTDDGVGLVSPDGTMRCDR